MPKDRRQSKVGEAVLEYLVAATDRQELASSKLSSKNQITLPVAMVRALGLKPGRNLMLRLEGDRIVLKPEPEDWVDYYRGRLKGVYGSTIEEMDAYVRKERESWERRENNANS